MNSDVSRLGTARTNYHPSTDYVASAYVVHENRVLLVWHAELHRWLAPGGHIEDGETPDECAVREIREETGIRAEVVDTESGPRSYSSAGVEILPRPLVVQREVIRPGHLHIDFVYVARTYDDRLTLATSEVALAQWCTQRDLSMLELPDNVARFARLALDVVWRVSETGG